LAAAAADQPQPASHQALEVQAAALALTAAHRPTEQQELAGRDRLVGTVSRLLLGEAVVDQRLVQTASRPLEARVAPGPRRQSCRRAMRQRKLSARSPAGSSIMAEVVVELAQHRTGQQGWVEGVAWQF